MAALPRCLGPNCPGVGCLGISPATSSPRSDECSQRLVSTGSGTGRQTGLPKDGTVKGVSYFSCPAMHGIFARRGILAVKYRLVSGLVTHLTALKWLVLVLKPDVGCGKSLLSSDHLLEASGSASTTLPSPTSSSKLLTPPSTSPIATPQSNAAKEDWTAGLRFNFFFLAQSHRVGADCPVEDTAETRLSVQVEIPKSAEVEEMKASDMFKICKTDRGVGLPQSNVQSHVFQHFFLLALATLQPQCRQSWNA